MHLRNDTTTPFLMPHHSVYQLQVVTLHAAYVILANSFNFFRIILRDNIIWRKSITGSYMDPL